MRKFGYPGNPDAVDAIGNTYLQYFAKPSALSEDVRTNPDAALRWWITCARNKFISLWRHTKHTTPYPEALPIEFGIIDTCLALDAHIDEWIYLNVLTKLTEEERFAVIQHQQNGLSFKEIAEEINIQRNEQGNGVPRCTVNAARMACRRGMDKLAEAHKQQHIK